MEIFKNPSFDFMSKRKLFYVASAVVILIGLMSIVINGGMLYHLDFTGGLSMEISPRTEDGSFLTVYQVREALNRSGVTDAQIQEIPRNNSFLIRARSDFQMDSVSGTVAYSDYGMAVADDHGSIVIERILRDAFPAYTAHEDFVLSRDYVGPRAGADLRRKAVDAVLLSLLFMLIYIWVRFRFTWGFACAFGLFHDTMIALAVLSLAGIEIGMTVMAALLTIIGYSINNTIVIFDRIRENLKLYRKEDDYAIINRSINETLNRNVVLVFTTLLTIASLLIFGGPVIHDFAFTLMVGIIAGTFSSIWIVTGIVMDIVLATKRKGNTKIQVSSFKK